MSSDRTTTDGPMAPDGFRVGERVHHGIRGRQFKLIDFLWPRRNRMAEIADLPSAVWGTDCGVKVNAVDQLVHRTNRRLAEFGAPYGVRRVGDVVQVYDRRKG